MDYVEMIDTLIADGQKTISLVSNKRPTDDEKVFVGEYLVLDESGDIVARKIHTPESYGWSMVDWQGVRSGNNAEVLMRWVDLNDSAQAKGCFFLTGYV